jgi:hypothetical protein
MRITSFAPVAAPAPILNVPVTLVCATCDAPLMMFVPMVKLMTGAMAGGALESNVIVNGTLAPRAPEFGEMLNIPVPPAAPTELS